MFFSLQPLYLILTAAKMKNNSPIFLTYPLKWTNTVLFEMTWHVSSESVRALTNYRLWDEGGSWVDRSDNIMRSETCVLTRKGLVGGPANAHTPPLPSNNISCCSTTSVALLGATDCRPQILKRLQWDCVPPTKST